MGEANNQLEKNDGRIETVIEITEAIQADIPLLPSTSSPNPNTSVAST